MSPCSLIMISSVKSCLRKTVGGKITALAHKLLMGGADRQYPRHKRHVRDTLPDNEAHGGRDRQAAPFRSRCDARCIPCIYEGTYFHADSAGSRRRWQGNKRRLSRQIASSQPLRVIARLLFLTRRLPSLLFLRWSSLGVFSFAS